MKAFKTAKNVILNVEGRIGPPVLLYILGVPGGLCLLIWAFFFRGQ
ncbi:MAG: hypothetical protein ABI041_08725 [Bdellovibrionia bacterium]